MSAPYYADDYVELWHGDCREVGAWLSAEVLVTDPPYGMGYRSGRTHRSIANDDDTAVRDAMLSAWGDRPGLVFGSVLWESRSIRTRSPSD